MTEEQFSALVVRYQRLVYTICYQMTRDAQTAEDLAQETFLSAYLHRDSARDTDLKPWFARIATNKAKDFLKSAYHRHTGTQDDVYWEMQPAADKPPGLELEEAEGEGEIKAAIEALKEPYLLVCRLYFLQQRTTAEISQLLGRPQKTVETQLYRAKQQLTKKLGGKRDGSVL